MYAALCAASSDARRVVLIGSDCPGLPPEILHEAFAGLDAHDAVIGPASDGGYYLIGFTSAAILSAPFSGIRWGHPAVFRSTMDVLHEHGVDVHVLPPWNDVDDYGDLESFFVSRKDLPAGTLCTVDFLRTYFGLLLGLSAPSTSKLAEPPPSTSLALANSMTVSVVIPVLREEARINEVIACLRTMDGTAEIIVVDGSADGETIKVITDESVKCLRSARGRARQMNKGATEARGDVLLFLHADTELPPGAFQRISSLLAGGRFVGGAFDLGLGERGILFRMIERAASRRSRLTRIPYGDQAIFLRRDYFRKIGGYGDMAIMEDVDLMRRVKRAGGRICIIDDRVRTSARRWRQEGVIRCTLRNRTIMLRYLLGASPEELAKRYSR